MVIVQKYKSEDKSLWDQFVQKSKNGTFLFFRDYMEYHEKRFQDYSLLIYDEKRQLIALFPANKKDNIIYSHEGLTFGGFIVGNKVTTEIVLSIFCETKNFLKKNNINKMIYKCIPFIYHKYPAEEDQYALFVNDACLVRRDVSTAIYLPERYAYQERRMRAVKKAIKHGVKVKKSEDYNAFWQVLTEVLYSQHNTTPVHSIDEIILLAKRFKDNIKLYIATLDERILAGTVIFENDKVAHTQYLANSEEGRSTGALDLVIHYLVTEVYKDKIYFDFGISNEKQGRFLNTGLIAQKEGFGARAVVHDFYSLDI
ncbi:GNAT family N-acetyltransferase [Sporomusa acidovorans]|uniref:BioF2-like acetyltransferase domain-containing protein n=4 Tax=Sporomusa TaxID=2375 RepID=A0ABZ3IXM7_SPOA4|nr:GNAT family N-acetyltransferase [Sporomusa acidovorans]OZC13780.1 hypothetical protein SPACI_55740 [Sporomusa acidovorans DSM 3132]SDF87751.1 Acetyltransferase (GNAT) domain-containing protein [Sporomusa acidovorans]